METLVKAERTQDMLDAYREINFAEHHEKLDSVLIDYHGTGNNMRGNTLKSNFDKRNEVTFSTINELAKIIGDGTLPRNVVETSG